MSKLEDSLFREFKIFGLELPTRQHVFCPDRRWRLDFAWPEKKIAIEIHGGIHAKTRMRHSFGAEQEKDFAKINAAQLLGWIVFIFGPKWCYAQKRLARPSKALEFTYRLLRGTSAPKIRIPSIPTRNAQKTMELFT